MAARLTTTTYCLLGLLHQGPTSAYELTKHMQRSALSFLWPRTEAAIYREIGRLADAGLAKATAEHNGERSRTVYRLTAAGRRALEAWLKQPGTGIRFECEAAVKAFFGDAATLADLEAQLAGVVAEFEDLARHIEPVSERWLSGALRSPERVHYTAMSADLITRLQLATRAWASEWLERVGSWHGAGDDPAKRAEAREVIEHVRDTINRYVSQVPDG